MINSKPNLIDSIINQSLQESKIININSGKSIGNIMDIEVLDSGKIESLIIEQSKNIFSLNRESEIRLYWNDIVKIGEDVILVQKQ